MPKHLEVVLKTIERCNINCTYCYFFNGGDDTYKLHPPYITKTTIEKLAKFLYRGVIDLGLETIQIIFHGGEPLMQKKQSFEEMCSHFNTVLSSKVRLSFALQTNGTLIDEEWIELFSKYNVGVGVSLDGPKEYNDLYRVDHRGKGTYDKVLRGIQLLNAASSNNQIGEIGLISVINPNYDARKIYKHFVDVLQVKKINFLLPDFTHDSFPDHKDIEKYTNFLLILFHEWLQNNNPLIKIRFFNSIIKLFSGGYSELANVGPSNDDKLLLVISSNGDIAPDDVLKVTSFWKIEDEINIDRIALKDYLTQSVMLSLNKEKNQLPTACKNCCWEKICNGGSLIHRYSKQSAFNNPSIFCETLKVLYATISDFLLKNGLPLDKLRNSLSV